MKFRPKFMAFALSGMPHKNVDEACQVLLHNFPEVLSVPSSRWSYLEGMPCLNIDREKGELSYELSGRENELAEFYDRYLSQDLDYFAISPELESPLYKLAEMFKGKPWPKLKFVQFRVAGPYTFGFTLKDKSGAPAFYNDTMRDVVIKHLAMKAK